MYLPYTVPVQKGIIEEENVYLFCTELVELGVLTMSVPQTQHLGLGRVRDVH